MSKINGFNEVESLEKEQDTYDTFLFFNHYSFKLIKRMDMLRLEVFKFYVLIRQDIWVSMIDDYQNFLAEQNARLYEKSKNDI